MGYNAAVIKGFHHNGLENFFRTGSMRGIQARHAPRLRLILGQLNAAAAPEDMDLPGLRLHRLAGRRKNSWSVRVSGNWRITFTVEGPDALNVNDEDYH